MTGRLLTVDEVADRARSDPSTVRRYIREGKLVATKPFGHWLVDEDELTRYLESSKAIPRPPAPRNTSRPTPALPAPPTGRAKGGSFRDRRRGERAA